MRRDNSVFWHGRSGKSMSFGQSLGHALRGLAIALVFEDNYRRQLVVFVGAMGVAVLLRFSDAQLILVVGLAAVVLAAELINSAFEALADAVHPDYSAMVQRAKDMAAGAVLLVSFAVLLAGLYLFIPPLLEVFAPFLVGWR